MLSKYSTKQHAFAQLSSKQMSKIQYKNIRAFVRYRDFRVVVFFKVHPVCAVVFRISVSL